MARTRGNLVPQEDDNPMSAAKIPGVSPVKKSNVSSLIIAAKMSGWDPTKIVGAKNLMPTVENPNAFGEIEHKTSPLSEPQHNAPDYGPQNIPSTKSRGGDPFAGMGKF